MSQMSLFGGSSAPTKEISDAPKRDRVGACRGCKKLICSCGSIGRANRISRNDDPESSKRAAKKLEIVLSWRQTVVWSAVKMMCHPDSPGTVSHVIASGGRMIDIELGEQSYTANEIALFCIQELDPNATQDTFRRRLGELVEKRLCVRSPVEQFCRFSGQEVIGYGMNSEVDAVVRLRGEKTTSEKRAAKTSTRKTRKADG